MKKIILSLAVLGSFGFYVAAQNTLNTSSIPLAVGGTTDNTNSGNGTPTTNNPSTNPSTNTPSPKPVTDVPKKIGIYIDGQYDGDSVDAYYGNVQVRVIITNGKLTDIKFLDYPHGAGNSNRINSRALPILRQEAISAQSAKIDAVSGASETSPAFIESLTSALIKAKA